MEMPDRSNDVPALSVVAGHTSPRSKLKMDYLVVDSVAFIKQSSLQEFGEHICSVAEIVAEIRDEASRQRLSFLPYKLDFRQPDSASIKTVSEFARKSGDYGALSVTDLKLIALTLMLTKEIEGDSRTIRTEPANPSTVSGSPFATAAGAVQLAGFHRPAKSKKLTTGSQTDAMNLGSSVGDAEHSEAVPDTAEKTSLCSAEDSEHDNSSEEVDSNRDSSTDGETDDESGESDSLPVAEAEGEGEGDWITPDNLHEAVGKMSLAFGDAPASETPVTARVACMTGDYAMQNVLIQMGLSVVSVDGMLIKRLRQWSLRCYGCFHITNDFSRKFCPSCGNMTLKRVAYTIDENGNRVYYISNRRTLNLRGTKYSLPTPHGGKHPKFPVLREDQRQAQNRPSRKALQKVNPLEENYIVRDSPFAYIDLTSRAARLGITGHNKSKHGDAVRRRNAQEPGLPDRRKNPNEARRKRK